MTWNTHASALLRGEMTEGHPCGDGHRNGHTTPLRWRRACTQSWTQTPRNLLGSGSTPNHRGPQAKLEIRTNQRGIHRVGSAPMTPNTADTNFRYDPK